jgi:hypothetical protein
LSEDTKVGDLTPEEKAKLTAEQPPRGVLPLAPPAPAKPLKTPVRTEAK